MADPAVISLLDKVRQPFNVNAVARAAAVAALGDRQHLGDVKADCDRGPGEASQIAGGDGLQCVPTSANFVLVDTGVESARVCEQLLRRGIAVRPGWQLHLPTHLRVTVGTEAENDAFLGALRTVCSLANTRAGRSR